LLRVVELLSIQENPADAATTPTNKPTKKNERVFVFIDGEDLYERSLKSF
jgi:hypothetical protein